MKKRSVIYIPVLITILSFFISFFVSWSEVSKVLQRESQDLASKELFYQMLKDNLFLMFIIIVVISLLMYHLLKHSHGQIERNYNTQLFAVAKIYYSLHVIDLKQNSFREINASSDDLRKAIGNDIQNAHASMQGVMRMTVDECFLETMLEFTDLSTVADRLVGKHTITQEFLGKDNVWGRARFITVETGKNDRAEKVFFGVEIIDEEKRRENKLRQLSETDGLTGINNRATGEQAIKEYMASKTEGMFGLLDADKFKYVNDTYGHAVGDEVICAIAKALKSSFRGHDVVMRLGGDEFAFFAVGVTDTTLADKVITRFFDAIDAIHIPALTDYAIHVSLGASFYTVDSNLSFTELYNKADDGTYASKKISGNSYTIL